MRGGFKRSSGRSTKRGAGEAKRLIKRDEMKKPAIDFQKPVKSSTTVPNTY